MLPMQWKTLSVAEPADGQLCAVYDPHAAACHIWPARWDAGRKCFDAAAGWFEADEVKAWMPLPEPPNVRDDRQATPAAEQQS